MSTSIVPKTVVMYHSALTGCDYESYEAAQKAEAREMLAQAMNSDMPVDMRLDECNDIATWLVDRYPELWKSPNDKGLTIEFIESTVASRVAGYVSSGNVREVLTALYGSFNVVVTAKV